MPNLIRKYGEKKHHNQAQSEIVDTFWNNYWQSLESYYNEKYDLNDGEKSTSDEAQCDLKTSDKKND